jgi:hypothetical protein
VLVQELDRILDRHDVTAPGAIDLVDQGGERRGLARTRGAGHQHESTLEVGEALDDRGHAQLLERLDLPRDRAHDGAERFTLLEDVDAEPGVTGDGIGEVQLELFLEDLALPLRHDAVEGLLQLARGQLGVPVDHLHLTADPDGRRGVRGEV